MNKRVRPLQSSNKLLRTLRIGTGVERSLATCRGCTRKCACLSVLGLCLLSRTLKFCARQVNEAQADCAQLKSLEASIFWLACRVETHCRHQDWLPASLNNEE